MPYPSHVVKAAERLRRQGFSNPEIAKVLDVHRKTVWLWEKEHYPDAYEDRRFSLPSASKNRFHFTVSLTEYFAAGHKELVAWDITTWALWLAPLPPDGDTPYCHHPMRLSHTGGSLVTYSAHLRETLPPWLRYDGAVFVPTERHRLRSDGATWFEMAPLNAALHTPVRQ